MRNMSFALTTQQILEQRKTVTRRLGWKFLKAGDLLQPVKKCQGIKPGESVEKIGGPIRVERISRETLSDLISHDGRERGWIEVCREGFPSTSPLDFIAMFCEHMRPCQPNWEVTRIEFSYVVPK